MSTFSRQGHIDNLLSGRPGEICVTARDNRLFVEAVLYRYRASIPWRDLPKCCGDFRGIHTRFVLMGQTRSVAEYLRGAL